MTYRIEGLEPGQFAPLFELDDEALAVRQARRVVAEGSGYPCRVSLEEAEAGERLILTNFVSQNAATPFRTAYAIYVRENAKPPTPYVDALPPMIERRTLGLRGFDQEGMLRGALLALPGEGDERICELFDRPEIASIHAHNAAYGCFLARVERN